jgi:hypothetical protein
VCRPYREPVSIEGKGSEYPRRRTYEVVVNGETLDIFACGRVQDSSSKGTSNGEDGVSVGIGIGTNLQAWRSRSGKVDRLYDLTGSGFPGAGVIRELDVAPGGPSDPVKVGLDRDMSWDGSLALVQRTSFPSSISFKVTFCSMAAWEP